MDKVTHLNKFKLKKHPQVFSVTFKYDGEACYFSAEGIGNSPRERLKLAVAMEGAAKALRRGIFRF